MKKIILLLGFAMMWAAVGGGGGAQSAENKLPEKGTVQSLGDLDARFQNWLNMVAYITFKDERDVFLKLGSDRERDAFIALFWAQRDPTPGTPENEFKDEIEKRFAYANENFRRGTSRPGWMTDRGRIYMILGKPASEERFDNKMGLYPVQVWYYYGDASLGLPTYFNVVFYQRLGMGEWKIYNPAVDGPAELLVQDNSFDRNDYAAIYRKIKELAPTLAGPAMSMLPDDDAAVSRPSMRSAFILASVYESPVKKLSVSYATNFLNYRSFVNLEQSTNFIENTRLVSVSRDERYDFNLVTISIRPKKISLGYNDGKDQYFFNLNLNVSLRQGEKIIYQYAKNFEFYFAPDRVGGLEGGGVVIHDSFPVIAGDYQLVVFIENAVGKEFTYFDQAIRVPGIGGLPFLAAPVMGYKEETEANNFFHAYKFANKKLSVDTDRTFGLRDTPVVLIGVYNLTREMWEKGEVELELKGLSERTPFRRSLKLPLRDRPYARDVNLLYPIDKSGLAPDYYELKLRLNNPLGITVDGQSTEFTISPMPKFSHPIEAFKQALEDNPYMFYLTLGRQCEGAGDLEKACLYYEKTVGSKADFPEGWLALLRTENRLKKYAQVLSTVDNLKPFDKFIFDYRAIKGTALFGLEKFAPALDELLAANRIYDSDPRVLNLIGYAFLKLNDPAEALKAFEGSLSLNRKQPAIEKIIADIRSRLPKGPPAGPSGGK